MLPDRCSVRHEGKPCVNPPEFVISVVSTDGEYMVGVTCNKHKEAVSGKLVILQSEGKIPKGKINFSGLKPVGTDCIKADENDLIQL
ncbi:MAG: hypothetical protein R3230_05000 [Nitrosopumilaceae archaeon]|nr:hypothetical protein [Nitrosopumilaceae archaeon]